MCFDDRRRKLRENGFGHSRLLLDLLAEPTWAAASVRRLLCERGFRAEQFDARLRSLRTISTLEWAVAQQLDPRDWAFEQAPPSRQRRCALILAEHEVVLFDLDRLEAKPLEVPGAWLNNLAWRGLWPLTLEVRCSWLANDGLTVVDILEIAGRSARTWSGAERLALREQILLAHPAPRRMRPWVGGPYLGGWGIELAGGRIEIAREHATDPAIPSASHLALMALRARGERRRWPRVPVMTPAALALLLMDKTSREGLTAPRLTGDGSPRCNKVSHLRAGFSLLALWQRQSGSRDLPEHRHGRSAR
jgi:hypothetical protein